uniref:2,3-bisphosphoglycerate-independent phosphoglycerate mutase n=1 Tax=Lygus hesperus TaxID=30085 RepID=A0A0A9XII2_LYGHE
MVRVESGGCKGCGSEVPPASPLGRVSGLERVSAVTAKAAEIEAQVEAGLVGEEQGPQDGRKWMDASCHKSTKQHHTQGTVAAAAQRWGELDRQDEERAAHDAGERRKVIDDGGSKGQPKREVASSEKTQSAGDGKVPPFGATRQQPQHGWDTDFASTWDEDLHTLPSPAAASPRS